MRFSDEPLVVAFLEKWDSFGERDHEALSFQAVALAAEINPRHLLGEILIAIREHSVNSVKIIAVAAHPDITRKRVQYAKTPGGYRDRDKLDEMLGAIKPAAGNTFINKLFAGKSEETQDEPASVEMVDDANELFPESSVIQETLQSVRQKVLEAK